MQTKFNMADTLSPFVYWGQNNDKIFLKVDLKEVKNPDVDLTEEHLKVKVDGHGMRGRNDYEFKMDFYLPIDPDTSRYRVTERCIEFQIDKYGKGEIWPRLMYEAKRPAWLKIDFDHFTFDDSEEEERDAAMDRAMIDKLESELKETENTAFQDMTTFYLFVYNMFMWTGYTYVFIILCYRYYKHGEASKKDAYEAVGAQLMVCQLAAVLEILHPLVGLVKTSPVMPLLQVFGRNLILFVLIAQEPRIQEREVVWWLFFTWASVELIRYPYYMLTTIKMELWVITYLRYTVWIPLYPLGFVFEGFVMLLSLPYYEQSGRWSVEMPNSVNMSFHFPTFLRAYMLLFLPGMYVLMKRMYEQRKKKIEPAQRTRRPRKTKVQ